MMKLLRYWWRVIKWAIKSLWKRYPRPTIADGRKYARGYLRKLYKPILQGLDRTYNKTRDEMILRDRRLQARRRRLEYLPEEMKE
jgi:hypothetical protein